jgi:hypothetical protein
VASDPVFVLGGAQTDFAGDLTRDLGGRATTSAAFVLGAGAP